ncbi:hypothetical protein ACQ4LE_002246 [Meloidogyne hapla]|uniref:FLYWCH-type domain-containing protein n=1 Tax=Meloidogyne hapla TaxID=6305 RepID=A0A1I8B6H1_MELHA
MRFLNSSKSQRRPMPVETSPEDSSRSSSDQTSQQGSSPVRSSPDQTSQQGSSPVRSSPDQTSQQEGSSPIRSSPEQASDCALLQNEKSGCGNEELLLFDKKEQYAEILNYIVESKKGKRWHKFGKGNIFRCRQWKKGSKKKMTTGKKGNKYFISINHMKHNHSIVGSISKIMQDLLFDDEPYKTEHGVIVPNTVSIIHSDSDEEMKEEPKALKKKLPNKSQPKNTKAPPKTVPKTAAPKAVLKKTAAPTKAIPKKTKAPAKAETKKTKAPTKAETKVPKNLPTTTKKEPTTKTTKKTAKSGKK